MSEHRDQDARTIGGLIHALYESISGPAGQARDWHRQASLFHPAARSMRTGIDEAGQPWVKIMDGAEYRSDTEPFFAENDFYEVEIARQEQVFGNVASVRSVYEARRRPDDPVPERRGVNFIHLYHDGQRWWLMNIIWDNERQGVSMPDTFLNPRTHPDP